MRKQGFWYLLRFTLIELMVVVGIVCILMTMLLPALKRARILSRQMACMSGLRQAALAHSLYMTDNDRIMVASGYANKGDIWYDRLVRENYTKEANFTSIGGCPDSPDTYQLNDDNDVYYGHNNRRKQSSYSINVTLTGSIDWSTKEWKVKYWDGSAYYYLPSARMLEGRYRLHPTNTMLFGCSTVPNFVPYGSHGLTFLHTLGVPTQWIKNPSKWMRHGGISLPLYFSDGHAELVNYRMWKLDTDREIRWTSVCAYNKGEPKNAGGSACPDKK